MLRDLLRQRAWSRTPSHSNADEADVYRGHLSQAQYLQTRARTQDLSLPAARPGRHAAQPGLGHGYHLHPDGAWFVYLAAVVDWFSRRVLAWKLSITMETSFCIEALEEALSMNEKPEMFNTDQGSQFTSEAFTGRLKEKGIAISMDGKGRWRDNVFVERIWKSIKYEEVYLHAYDSVHEATASIGKYISFYNSIRPHSSLKALTPDQVYFTA